MGEFIALGYCGDGSKMSYGMGYNPSLTGANRETIWNTGGIHTWMGAEAGLEVVSDSADDDGDPVGTGARTCLLTYLDSDFIEHTEEITLNGVGVVATDATDIYRINDFRVHSVGSGGVAAGTIVLRELDDSPTFATIDVGETRSRQLIYTVPDGFSLQMNAFAWASSGAAARAYIKYTLMTNYCDACGNVNGVFYPMMEVSVQNDGMVYVAPVPLVLPEHTDVFMSGIGDAQTLTAAATSSWRGTLTKND